MSASPQTVRLSMFDREGDMARPRHQAGSLIKRGGWWVGRFHEQVINEDGTLGSHRPSERLGRAVGPGRITSKEARRRMTELMAEVNAQANVPRSLMTVRQFAAQQFSPKHVAKLKPAGRKHWRYILDSFILLAIGDVRLRDLTPALLQSLVDSVLNRNYAVQTAAHVKHCCSGLYEFAMRSGYVALGANPARLVVLPERRPARRVEPYTWEQAKQILEVLPPPIWEMCYLSMTITMNVAELCGLRVKWVNLSDAIVVVEGETLFPWTLKVVENYYERQYGSTKNANRRRPLPIPELVRPRLAALCAGKSPEQPVFTNRKGELPIDPHNVTNRLFKKLGRQLGFKVNWHRFRHSAATFLDYLGADPRDSKALMGQASDRALAIYTHPLERQRLLVEAVGARLMETTGRVQ